MSQCNILSFTIMTQYYRKNWEELCCWLPPAQTYDDFISGLTTTYNDSCLKDRVFSDYVTRLFNECLTGSSSDGIYVTGGTANGTNDTLVFTNNSGGTFTVANSALLFNDAYVSGGTLDSATGCVTFVNTSGGTFQVCGFDGFTSYWSANTYGDITTSGGTDVFLSAGTGTTYPLTIERDNNGHFLKFRDNSHIQQDYTFESESSGTFYGLNLKNKDGDTIVNFAANAMLGIGTIDPTVAIDIDSALSAADALQVRISGKGGIGHTNAGQTRTIIGNSYKNAATRFGVTMGGYTTGDELLTIMGTGDVGVGTGDETIRARLHVSGTTILTDNLSVSGNSALVGILGVTGKTYLGDVAAAGASYTNNEILVRSSTAAVEYLTIAQLKEDIADSDLWSANTFGIINSGLTSNVGIGTATPNEKLTVEGSISASTDLYVSGDTSVAGILEITGKTSLGDQLLVKGGTTSASPTPQIKFSNYFDSGGGPSISHIDLYGGTYGFGISALDFDYISDMNHRFYSDSTALTGGTPALIIDGELNRVAINRSSSTSKALHVGGEVQVDTINAAGGGYTGDKILVSDGGVVEYLTTAELKQDIADSDLWTANTFGIINSGLTAHVGIGTNTPNKPLTVLGDISGTTAIYLGDPEGGIFISGETQADGDLSLHSNDDIEYYCGDDMVFNVACKIKFTELTGITPSLQLELDGSGNGHGVCFIENGLDNHILAISTADTRLYFVDVGGEWISGDTTDLSIGSGRDIFLLATNDVNIPVNVGLTFGDDGEKIEGDGTDLTISSGADIILTPTGHAGIGITVPTTKLHIVDVGEGEDPLRVQTVQTGNGYMLLIQDDGVVKKSSKVIGTVDGISATTLSGDTVIVVEEVGIGTALPMTALDVHHNPTGLATHTGGGEVVTFGSGTLVKGKLHYMNTSGAWILTNANTVGLGSSELIGIALGTSVSAGVLLRGFFDMTSFLGPGGFAKGVPLYVSGTVGSIAVTQPAGSTDFVRVVGYCTNTANVIYFNPDGTYIKIA